MRTLYILLIIMMTGVCCVAEEAETGTDPGKPIPIVEPYTSLEDLFSIYQPYLANIGPYKPIYFLYGTNPEDSRFQISLKYQLLGNECALDRSCEWLKGFNLGYTQTSAWDLKSDSSPFEDTRYQPEIFYLTNNVSFRPSFIDGLFYQAGVLHESNGRAGEYSRSTNYFYFSPAAIKYSSTSRLGIMVSPKLVLFFNNSDDTNPDLDKYRGNFGLDIKVGRAEGLVLDAGFRFAQEGVSTQLDITYPLGAGFLKNLEFYLHAQYSNALAETLVDYTERTEAVRIGIALLR